MRKSLLLAIVFVGITVLSPSIVRATTVLPAENAAYFAKEVQEQSNHAWKNVHVYFTKQKGQTCYVLLTGNLKGHKNVSLLHADGSGTSWKLDSSNHMEIRQDNQIKLHAILSTPGHGSYWEVMGYTSSPFVKSVQIELWDGKKPLMLYDSQYFAGLLTAEEKERFVSVVGLDKDGRVIERWTGQNDSPNFFQRLKHSLSFME